MCEENVCRMDWKAVVLEAHKNPVFIEDLAGWKCDCPKPFAAVAQFVAEEIFPKQIDANKNGELTELAQQKLCTVAQ